MTEGNNSSGSELPKRESLESIPDDHAQPTKKQKMEHQDNSSLSDESQKCISDIPTKLGLISPSDNAILESLYLNSQKTNLKLRVENGGGKGTGFDGARKWDLGADKRNALARSVGNQLQGGCFAKTSINSTNADENETNTVDVSGSGSIEKKIPKRKVALLMSYNGTGYYGMQINPSVPSIELDLHKAIALAGGVSLDNAMDPAKMQFVRCARTDKGVHAAGQVISLKMIVEDQDIISKINTFLPPQIRVWGYVRTINNFHAKQRCDSRIYEYLLPTYVLQTVQPWMYPNSSVGVHSTDEASKQRKNEVFTEDGFLKPTTPEDLEKKRQYRVDEDTLCHFRSILKEYIGSHSFYNFTIGKTFKDKSTTRYIKSIDVLGPVERDGIEWITCRIHGQSFMLHQIRKMIGLAILLTRTRTPPCLIKETYTSVRFNIPKAPALGLLLVEPQFTEYNTTGRKKKIQGGVSDPLPELSFSQYTTQINEFKEAHIYPHIFGEERQNAVFDEWIRCVDTNADDFSWYMNADGSIALDRVPPQMKQQHQEHKEKSSKDVKHVTNKSSVSGVVNDLVDGMEDGDAGDDE